MCTLGALSALLPATHTVAFSRGERRLVVVRRRLGRTAREEYALRDVASAFVEASNSDEGGSTWRVVVQLADGRVIPVTSYYASGYDSKKRAADRICEFLDRAGNRSPDTARRPSAAQPLRGSLTTRRRKVGAMALLALFGLLFGGIGGTNMLREQRGVVRPGESIGRVLAPLAQYRCAHLHGGRRVACSGGGPGLAQASLTNHLRVLPV